MTCSDSSTCLTCNSPNRALSPTTLKCDCPAVGFYDDGVSETCFACMAECKTCTNSTKCTSCEVSLLRSLSAANRCPCIAKYFDVSGTCTACSYYCATCTAPTTCQTCNSTANRILNPSTSKCQCKPGYYDTGIE